MTQTASSLRKAAQYLRMSSERQVYSLGNQAAVIAGYAQAHGFELVRTYEDAGVSGLGMKGRAGLRELLADVAGGAADYEAILVYDVSRWGRFQDPDESAHYEFLCRQAGVSVVYCADDLGSGGIRTAVLKQLKRVMAAEYSRRLSRTISDAQWRLAGQGFWQGGAAPYGLRRCELDAAGRVARVMGHGEQKALAGRRIVLALGPAGEAATVRKIYRLFLNEGVTRTQIARRLNVEGPVRPDGHRWTFQHVMQILTNPLYAGDLAFGRAEHRLGAPLRRKPRSDWLLVKDVIPPIVSRRAQARAARLMARKIVILDDEALIAGLRALFLKKGELSASLINAAEGLPAATTYINRFGSLIRAYELVGYRPADRRGRGR